MAGGKIILSSATPKGWTARVPRTATSVEHPGTAVQWDGESYEVVAAEPAHGGGVRYLLSPWRDEEVMRFVDTYDAETEALRLADFARARRQRKQSLLTRWSGILLGNLPARVQNHLGDELGVSPARMTSLSALPSLLLLGFCVWRASGIALGVRQSGVPIWLWLVAYAWLTESFIRFQVAMTQSRGMGSLAGTILYSMLFLIAPKRWGLVPPTGGRGNETFMLPASQEQAFRDSVAMREPLLTLLVRSDQLRLAESCGFDYRRNARAVTLVLLSGSALGVISMWKRAMAGESVSATVSFVLAAVLAADQVRRLIVLRHGPAGSILAPLIRPFMRDLLVRKECPPGPEGGVQ